MPPPLGNGNRVGLLDSPFLSSLSIPPASLFQTCVQCDLVLGETAVHIYSFAVHVDEIILLRE